MKKFQLFNWLFVAFIAFQFSSCSDEPLEGEFPGSENPDNNGPSAFVAVVDGVSFTASTANATFLDGVITVLGTDAGGNTISITLNELGECTYNLSSLLHFATYIPNGETANPFSSTALQGGSGSLTVTGVNVSGLAISGSFSFQGAREITDSSGMPTTVFASIESGSFTNVPIQVATGTLAALDCSTIDTGGDGEDPIDPEDPVLVDEFFALVDGVEHVDEILTTTITTVGDEMMIKIEAQTATGALIRIDVPYNTGIGTFDMEEDISDGTKLIGVYNPNTGGENLSSNPGSITFSQFDTVAGVIQATFSFTATDPLLEDPSQFELTEGSFTLYFAGMPNPDPVPFRALIDGLAFEPTQMEIEIIPEVINDIDIRYIEATLANGKKISIGLPLEIEVGSYAMSTEIVDGTETVGLYSTDASDLVFASNPGTLTVNSYDIMTGDISATFSFTAIDQSGVSPSVFQITEGEFNQNIQ